MKREEILKLIDDKDAQDKIFVQRGEEKAKYTEEIFHIIKQEVMDDLIKIAVDRGYSLDNSDISYCVLNNILKSDAFDINWSIVSLTHSGCFYSMHPESGSPKCDVDKVWRFINSFDTSLLYKNVRILIEKHGFVEDERQVFPEWKTTKEKLLSYPEIIYEGVERGFETSKTDSEYKPNDKSLIAWQILGVVIVLLVLFLCKVYF